MADSERASRFEARGIEMTIHHSHKLAPRTFDNGLLDPWHRCAVCGAEDAELAEPCTAKQPAAAATLPAEQELQPDYAPTGGKK